MADINDGPPRNMVNSCSVYRGTSNCNTKDKTNYINIFTFPEGSVERAEWMRKFINKDLKVTNNFTVCIKHFEEKDIKRFDKYNFNFRCHFYEPQPKMCMAQ